MPNPLHAWLDLNAFPWQMTRADLATRYGVRPHVAYRWDVIEIETANPLLSDLLWPISAQAFSQFATSMPATEFFGTCWHSIDARDNLRRVVGQLVPILGPGQINNASNSRGHRWVHGPATLDLHAFPPELQGGPRSNPSHDREPRLRTGCSVSIKTGFRLPVSERERDQVKSFEPILRLHAQALAVPWMPRLPVVQSLLEFIRKPELAFDACRDWVGRSEDRSALIVFSDELYVIPVDRIMRLEVRRTLPAKGPGGSSLGVVCTNGEAAGPARFVEVRSAPGATDLDQMAATISLAIDKPLALLPYDYDC